MPDDDFPAAPVGAWFHPHPEGFEAGASLRSARGTLLLVAAAAAMAAAVWFLSHPVPGRSPVIALCFAVLALWMAWQAALHSWGGVTLRRHGYIGEIFTGVGSFGKTLYFHWARIDAIGEKSRVSRFGRTQTEIILDVHGAHRRGIASRSHRLAFGGDLRPEHRAFLLELIQRYRSEEKIP